MASSCLLLFAPSINRSQIIFKSKFDLPHCLEEKQCGEHPHVSFHGDVGGDLHCSTLAGCELLTQGAFLSH